ncbi:uncharacterized protein LOC118348512 [Juglans regia]|uniref:Uncharacterized protein LOC118348512 n=1 Tax=Juglans regia TaxID=51240 RepID=A0A6P9EQW4_JUGRE|nr:uncharacterized protein LOC118348512 [Juglans regia]
MARSFFRKLLLNLSSEDVLEVVLNDEDGSTLRRGRNHHKYIQRDHIQGHKYLFRDYFAKSLVYPSNSLSNEISYESSTILRIQHEVEAYEPYFIQIRNNAGRLSLYSMQKITAAIRMLSYGVTGDFMDKYLSIGESTAMERFKKFAKTIVTIFSNEYLQSSNVNDIA